jgi:hypothetical protein
MDTGEEVLVGELDPETSPGLSDPTVLALLRDVLEWCSFVSRESVEEAKRGFTRALQSELRSTPTGALIRLRTPSCRLLKTCASADPENCTTRRMVRRRPAFPHCWEAVVEEGNPESVSAARNVATYVVHAWREGRTVLIISSSSGRDLLPKTSCR